MSKLCASPQVCTLPRLRRVPDPAGCHSCWNKASIAIGRIWTQWVQVRKGGVLGQDAGTPMEQGGMVAQGCYPCQSHHISLSTLDRSTVFLRIELRLYLFRYGGSRFRPAPKMSARLFVGSSNLRNRGRGLPLPRVAVQPALFRDTIVFLAVAFEDHFGRASTSCLYGFNQPIWGRFSGIKNTGLGSSGL